MDARQVLGLASTYTAVDVVTAFRRLAPGAHPDLGGEASEFTQLVEARDMLLRNHYRGYGPIVVVADRRAWSSLLELWRRAARKRPSRVL